MCFVCFVMTSFWKEQRLTVILRKLVILLIRDLSSRLTGVYADSIELPSELRLCPGAGKCGHVCCQVAPL